MNTKENDLGNNFTERKEYINNKLKGSDPINRIPIFSGTSNESFVPVYMVDINFPIYRLSNIRTKSSQQTYISKNALEIDFFKKDPECREALKVQHELLYEISISGGDEKNHYKTFENESFDKAHPMMMSDDGILINGNTRMSAIRELYYSDPVRFKRYEKVPIALLPANLTERDIRKLELNLQINPDIHKDYPWISEAMDCRDQLYLGRSEKEIEEEYKRRQNDVSHPINLINELSMADIFLDLYEKKGEYDLLEKDQFALLEWYKFRGQHKSNANRVKIIDIICFEIIKSKIEGYRESQLGDIYKQFRKLNKVFSENSETWNNLFKQYKIDLKVSSNSHEVNGELNTTTSTTTTSSYDFLNENLDIIENQDTNVGRDEERNIVEAIQDSSKQKDRDKSVKIVEAVLSVTGAVEESEKRNKSKNIINVLVLESLNNIDYCIKSLIDDDKEFEKLEETILEIEKFHNLLDILKDTINKKLKK
jgi:hypothetical protein